MQAENQQKGDSYPCYCTKCNMYYHLPHGQAAYVCMQSKQLMALRQSTGT